MPFFFPRNTARTREVTGRRINGFWPRRWPPSVRTPAAPRTIETAGRVGVGGGGAVGAGGAGGAGTTRRNRGRRRRNAQGGRPASARARSTASAPEARNGAAPTGVGVVVGSRPVGSAGGADARPSTPDFVSVNLPANQTQSTTTRIWAIRPNGTTPMASSEIKKSNQMLCCYVFFIILGFLCVGLGLGIMIRRVNDQHIGDMLGYCILVVFGVCLELYAVFDIFKYVEAERSFNYEIQRRRHLQAVVTEGATTTTSATAGASAQRGDEINVIAVVPTDPPPAYMSQGDLPINLDEAEAILVHAVTSIPLSLPPSYRTFNNNNTERRSFDSRNSVDSRFSGGSGRFGRNLLGLNGLRRADEISPSESLNGFESQVAVCSSSIGSERLGTGRLGSGSSGCVSDGDGGSGSGGGSLSSGSVRSNDTLVQQPLSTTRLDSSSSQQQAALEQHQSMPEQQQSMPEQQPPPTYQLQPSLEQLTFINQEQQRILPSEQQQQQQQQQRLTSGRPTLYPSLTDPY